MKKIRKYTLGGIAAFLLLCFSVIILPTDVFHEHNPSTSTSCKTSSGQQCQHKMHLANKASFCWLCAIHFDKNFTPATPSGKLTLTPVFQSLLLVFITPVYQSAILHYGLRAPPMAN